MRSFALAKVAILMGILVLWAAPVLAEEWPIGGGGPNYVTMTKTANNVIFGQITATTRTSVRVAIGKALKGKAHDEINIVSFDKRKYMPVKDPRETFKKGEDYYFFLGAAMIGSVPFEPIADSIYLPVEHGKIKTSIIAPTLEQYVHELDFEFFDAYLEALIAIQESRAIDPAFLGQLLERLEKSANDPNSTMTPTYFTMVTQLQPGYDKETVLMAMAASPDVNSRVLAVRQMALIAPHLKGGNEPSQPEPEPKDKGGKKGKKAARPAKRAKTVDSYYERIYGKLVQMVNSDKSRLVQSAAAMALAAVDDFRAISILAERIDATDDETPELCEVHPVALANPTRKAVITAIVSFDSDEALDVLERELLKNKVETFRLILEIFKDYTDTSLHLLLLDLLQDANFLPRQVAILEYFRSIKDDATIEGLKKLFLSPEAGSEFIRKSIVEVFQDYKEPKTTTEFLLEHGLHDPSPVVRQATAKALGTLGDPTCVPKLKDIYFKESNRLAREFYVETLSMIRSRDAFETLRWLKEKETDGRMLEQIEFALKKSKYLSQ